MWIKLFLALSLTLAASAVQAQPKLLTWHDVEAFPHGDADCRIAYGPDPLQFGELWRPKGAGPHPLVVMIHGGCWRADLPGLELQRPLSEALARRGWAVWNIEYRRIGHDGGAYPGTFSDVAQAIDAVRDFAAAEHLDLSRVVFMGHSAGGHLAAWAAGGARRPESSPLWTAHPLAPLAVVSLAGIVDLEAYHATGPDACGGPGVVESLVDLKGRGPGAYADTSPLRLLPAHVRQLVVSGAHDPIVPPRFGEAYAAAARQAGAPVEAILYPEAGHFELIDPGSSAWAKLFPLLDALAAPHPKTTP
jgi:acetyl esterase/lipase